MRSVSDPQSGHERLAPTLAAELLFAGGVASGVPAFIAFLFQAIWPMNDQAFTFGVAYGIFGLTSVTFARRRARQLADPRLTGSDRTWFMRSYAARTIAAAGSACVGLSLIAIRFIPAWLARHGYSESASSPIVITACFASLLFSIAHMYHLPNLASRESFWHGYPSTATHVVKLTTLQALVILAALLVAFVGPIVACGIMALRTLP